MEGRIRICEHRQTAAATGPTDNRILGTYAPACIIALESGWEIHISAMYEVGAHT